MADRARRRGGHPLVVLVSLAVTAGMVLLVLWQWLDARAYATADPAPVATVPAGSPLTTPVLSVRRAPTVLAHSVTIDAFRAALQPVLAQVGGASCASFWVDGERVDGRNETAAVIPASTMKLLVASAALDVLGPDRTFTTAVTGSLGAGGAVAGDLTLVGGGDPVLTSRAWSSNGFQRYPPIEITRLEDLADAVQDAGVTSVSGSVRGDGSRYDDERFNPTWSAGIRVQEAGPIGGLLVDDGRSGGVALDDPALAAAQVFTRLLRDRGITVAGDAAVGTAEPGGVQVASVTSSPLSAIVHEMLETSDDNTAEMLVKEIGVVTMGEGSTRAGLTAVRASLEGRGVPLDGVTVVDGSGLSRENRLTCAAMLAVLELAPVDGPIVQGMAIAGTTGTLTPEFVGTPVAGVLRAKTGSLTDVKALAGTLPVEGGSAVRFALLLNAPGIREPAVYRPIWDDLLATALASYPSTPNPSQLAPR